MKYTIKKCGDLAKVRSIHKMAFAEDSWPGDDHEFWVAYDEHGGVAGFASAVLMPTQVAFFSRCAITLKHRGFELHRQLITTRLKWAKAEGAVIVITYVTKFSYASMVNLLRAEFRFASRSLVPCGNDEWHVMLKILRESAGMLKGHITQHINAMMEAP